MLDINDVRCYNLRFLTFLLTSSTYYFATFHNYFYHFVVEVQNISSISISYLQSSSSSSSSSGCSAPWAGLSQQIQESWLLPKDRSSTANSGTKVVSRCGSFLLVSALRTVGILKITPHSYPWLEVDIGKIMCPLFRFSKYGNPKLTLLSSVLIYFHHCSLRQAYCAHQRLLLRQHIH